MKRLTISRSGEWHRAVLYTTARSIINHGTRNRISKWQMEQAIKDGRSLNGWRIMEVKDYAKTV
ncbi:hypothetical protein [Secundilactobacillus muriivasis]